MVESLHDPNGPPTMVLNTTPPAVPGDPHPVIEGFGPLTVKFNLCKSSDPDQDPGDHGEADSLNWQFHFGDDGTEPFNSDGSFNANFAHFCRTEHVYQVGTYVATVSVTDKHLHDQSGGVDSEARVTRQLTINVEDECGNYAFHGSPASMTSADGVAATHHNPVRVSGVECRVVDVDVSLHITSTFLSDLEIDLLSPRGLSSRLFDNRGGSGTLLGTSCGDRTRFDDAAATDIGAGAAPFAGSFRPETPLSVFNGLQGSGVNGNWNLRVTDTFGGGPDSLNCWSLGIATE